MSKTKIVLNRKGVRELLKSQPMADACREQAEQVKARAGEGYEVQQQDYPERARYIITAETDEAKRDNLKNNTLLKALGV